MIIHLQAIAIIVDGLKVKINNLNVQIFRITRVALNHDHGAILQIQNLCES